jgi:hypothetical protein
MPIVAMVAIDLLDMAVLRLTLAPFQHYSRVEQEHGRTIPLTVVRSFFCLAYCAVKIAFGIMPWMPLVPSTTWVT